MSTSHRVSPARSAGKHEVLLLPSRASDSVQHQQKGPNTSVLKSRCPGGLARLSREGRAWRDQEESRPTFQGEGPPRWNRAGWVWHLTVSQCGVTLGEVGRENENRGTKSQLGKDLNSDT